MALSMFEREDLLPRNTPTVRTVLRFPLLIAQEARGAVLLVYALRLAAGTLLVPGPFISAVAILHVSLAFLSMLFSVTCVYLYNGLRDLAEDEVNGSRRPLASHRLKPAAVRRTIGALIGGVVVIGVFVPPSVSVCNAAMLLLGYIYSGGHHPAKVHGTVALVVAALGASVSYLATGTATAQPPTAHLILTAALLGGWVLAGGAAKDLSDVRGDAAAGRHTLPVRVGDHRARVVIAYRIAVISVVAAGASTLGLAAPGLLLMPVCAGILIPLSLRAARGQDRTSRRLLYRAFMASQFGLNGALVLIAVVPW